MELRIAAAAVLVLALAGCAGGESVAPGDPDRPSPRASVDRPGPISLIGLWTVDDTDEEAGTVLRIAPKNQLSLWRTCGTLFGGWAGSRDVFIGEVNGATGNCLPPTKSLSGITPSWLRTANGYTPLSDGTLELVDRAGRPVARLVPGGKPKVGPDVAASEAEPPGITARDRAELTRTVRLPSTLTPVDPARIAGRWIPVADGGDAFVEFEDDGTWTGTDGCNSSSGRWTASANSMLATSGASTLIGCEGARVAAWLTRTAVAGFQGGVLVLLDTSGAEVGRLKKS